MSDSLRDRSETTKHARSHEIRLLTKLPNSTRCGPIWAQTWQPSAEAWSKLTQVDKTWTEIRKTMCGNHAEHAPRSGLRVLFEHFVSACAFPKIPCSSTRCCATTGIILSRPGLHPARIWSSQSHKLSKSVRTWPASAKHCPSSAQIWPKSARLGQKQNQLDVRRTR